MVSQVLCIPQYQSRSPRAQFVLNSRRSDTNIIDWVSSTLSAGMPILPVERVAGAMFCAATDPDRTTSGCTWMLPDDGRTCPPPQEGSLERGRVRDAEQPRSPRRKSRYRD
jgi:hypothetical protein